MSRLKHWLVHLRRVSLPSENTLLIGLAALLGLMTGFSVYLFTVGIDIVHMLFTERLAGTLLNPWIGGAGLVVSLSLAGALTGGLMQRFVGHERHHGVAGVIESVALEGGRLGYVKMPFKALASAVSLGAGASVGPEDPSVQIGANLGSFLGQRLNLSGERIGMLVAAGGASAIAAAFKAPIAGVFFALEVILNGSFTTSSVGVVILSAVVASAFMQSVEPGAELGPFSYTLGSPLEVLLFIPLGLALAPLASLLVHLVYLQQDFWRGRVPFPRWAKTALAGAMVGLVALFYPQIMGPGREAMNGVLSGDTQYTLILLAGLAIAKMIMTPVSMGGGFVGGIFAPSLFIGTMLGALYGRGVNAVFAAGQMGSAQAYAIAGMAAMMAGVVRAPITAIVLVFELTNDYRLILPIMMATVVCVIVAERIDPAGIYTRSLLRYGIRLDQGRDINMMRRIPVAEAMLAPAPQIAVGATLVELRDRLRAEQSATLCVVDEEERLFGVVTLSDLQRVFGANPDRARSLVVRDICTRDVATVGPDDSLLEAIIRMGEHDYARIPVLAPVDGRVVGLIGRLHVMRAYHDAIAKERNEQPVH